MLATLLGAFIAIAVVIKFQKFETFTALPASSNTDVNKHWQFQKHNTSDTQTYTHDTHYATIINLFDFQHSIISKTFQSFFKSLSIFKGGMRLNFLSTTTIFNILNIQTVPSYSLFYLLSYKPWLGFFLPYYHLLVTTDSIKHTTSSSYFLLSLITNKQRKKFSAWEVWKKQKLITNILKLKL